MASASSSRPGLRVLCLDGGGVRGLASLYILESIMNKIGPDAKPCDYFDLICGSVCLDSRILLVDGDSRTSTGALIAILLARLEYSVSDAIDKYMELATIIFKAAKTEERFFMEGFALVDERPMEAAFKKLAKGRDGHDLLMMNPGGKCRVCHTVLRGDSMTHSLSRSAL